MSINFDALTQTCLYLQGPSSDCDILFPKIWQIET